MTKRELIEALASLPDTAAIYLAGPDELEAPVVRIYNMDEPAFATLEIADVAKANN